MKHRLPRFDILDRHGQPLGYTASIAEAYRQGLWHRSVQVAVYTPGGQILVERRAARSLMLPSYLDISVAGGVDPGETPLRAAARETEEEVGIAAPLTHFEPLPVVRFDRHFPGLGVHSRAFIHPFLLPVHDQIELHLQQREVADARFIPLSQAKRLVGHHRLRWGRLIPHYIFYGRLLQEVERRLD